jgi:hypothetical protein
MDIQTPDAPGQIYARNFTDVVKMVVVSDHGPGNNIHFTSESIC